MFCAKTGDLLSLSLIYYNTNIITHLYINSLSVNSSYSLSQYRSGGVLDVGVPGNFLETLYILYVSEEMDMDFMFFISNGPIELKIGGNVAQ